MDLRLAIHPVTMDLLLTAKEFLLEITLLKRISTGPNHILYARGVMSAAILARAKD